MRNPKAAIPNELRQLVLMRDGYRCRYCGNDQGPFHMDHVYPESKGGETTLENLVTACEPCNIKKQARIGIWPMPIIEPTDDPGEYYRGLVKIYRKDLLPEGILALSVVMISFVLGYILSRDPSILNGIYFTISNLIAFYCTVMFLETTERIRDAEEKAQLL